MVNWEDYVMVGVGGAIAALEQIQGTPNVTTQALAVAVLLKGLKDIRAHRRAPP